MSDEGTTDHPVPELESPSRPDTLYDLASTPAYMELHDPKLNERPGLFVGNLPARNPSPPPVMCAATPYPVLNQKPIVNEDNHHSRCKRVVTEPKKKRKSLLSHVLSIRFLLPPPSHCRTDYPWT
eukprot:TRINITY_DN1559_c0_g1_i2.p1 TRINITY_DN1559_c0_g1~~TRINITY_DN1559_c0_g1_i2.p1  ORF type:complete len:125 (-),score=1.15 TRINITY_DN1559_c0_g1_i2:419-793(-)